MSVIQSFADLALHFFKDILTTGIEGNHRILSIFLLECPKLGHTSEELAKLYWDARRLME